MATGIASATRGYYTGPALELRTQGGRILSVTPNHPILTPFGFRPADSFGEGDYVISSLDSERVIKSIDPHDYHVPARIEEIWDSLVVAHGMGSARVPVSPIDFHGDAGSFKGDVDIVYPDSLLLPNGETSLPQAISQENLGNRYAQLLGFNGQGMLRLLGNSPVTAFGSEMSRCSECGKLFWRHSGKTEDIGFAASPWRYTGIKQHPADNYPFQSESLRYSQFGFSSNIAVNQVWGSRDKYGLRRDTTGFKSPVEPTGSYTEFATEFLRRFSGLITADKVVQVRQCNFAGHVYDLQSLEQLYIANGVIVHNCRCVWVPVI